jgi:hypothetical protein
MEESSRSRVLSKKSTRHKKTIQDYRVLIWGLIAKEAIHLPPLVTRTGKLRWVWPTVTPTTGTARASARWRKRKRRGRGSCGGAHLGRRRTTNDRRRRTQTADGGARQRRCSSRSPGTGSSSLDVAQPCEAPGGASFIPRRPDVTNRSGGRCGLQAPVGGAAQGTTARRSRGERRRLGRAWGLELRL